MTDYSDGLWHGWNGGECPVDPETVVDVAFSSPSAKPFYEHRAGNVVWQNGLAPSDIIAFRVTKPAPPKPREYWVTYDTRGKIGVCENPVRDDCDHEVIHVIEKLP